MKILSFRTLSGPNLYHRKPVLVANIALESLADTASTELPGFNERLIRALPGLKAHRCSPGRPGGFVERLERGTYFAHIIEHIALELSSGAGIEAGFGKSVYGGAPGIYQVIVRFVSEQGMKSLVESAVGIARSLARGEACDIASAIETARGTARRNALGPSTRAIVEAAERRGIPWRRLNDMSLIQFGWGKHRRYIQATTTSLTSDIGVDIAQDKGLTKRILTLAGIRVPRGRTVDSEEAALEAAAEIGGPVAIKPLDGNQGRGVSLRLARPEEIREAYSIAARESRSSVLVEECYEGRDYRVLVVGGKVVAASERIPAHVIGDGKSPIRKLIEIENLNPLRGEGHEMPLTRIETDEISRAHLLKNGLTLDSIPRAGERTPLRETANLSTGGTAEDATDAVHPEVRFVCERAARAIGLDICGVDLVIEDISKPFSGQRGGVIELNASPGIRMHHFPAKGSPRDAGGAIVDLLYPRGATGRIPIVSVTGTNGKTTVTRMISHALEESGASVGMTTSDGIVIQGRLVESGDTTGPASAGVVLSDPSVEVAVLETARGGIVRRGLGYDRSDISVLTNIQRDHIGQDGIEGIEDILRIKSLVAEQVREGGTLILNADDERLVALARSEMIARIPREILFFSLRSDNPVIRAHIESGNRACFARDGWLVEATRAGEVPLILASEIPLTLGGSAQYQIANALAAFAACRSYGLRRETIASAFSGFRPNERNSGRGNFYRLGQGFVMVDYGHNPEAFRAVSKMTASWSHREVTAIIAAPGDRSDDMIRESGWVAADGFDRIIIREDLDLRGRKAGETAGILLQAIRERAPSLECVVEADEKRAFERGIKSLRPGGVLVFFYDDLPLVQELLIRHGAESLEDPKALMKESNPLPSRKAG